MIFTVIIVNINSYKTNSFKAIEEGIEVVYLPRTLEISSSKIKKDLYDANAVDGESKTSHDDIITDPGR